MLLIYGWVVGVGLATPLGLIYFGCGGVWGIFVTLPVMGLSNNLSLF